MDIIFTNRKLAKICNSDKVARKKLGQRCADLLRQRLDELAALKYLEEIRPFPAPRCHELRENRKGQLAVDLEYPKRLIFKPEHNPIPIKNNGGLDWTKITAVKIIEIKDYHKND